MSHQETITACPECDSSNIHARVSSFVDTDDKRNDPDTSWYCNDCKTGFDDPIERERNTDTGAGYYGPVAELLEADPDEYP